MGWVLVCHRLPDSGECEQVHTMSTYFVDMGASLSYQETFSWIHDLALQMIIQSWFQKIQLNTA